MKNWIAGEKVLADDLNENFSEALYNSINGVDAGENLTAIKPAYISLDDGEVYTSHGFKELDSTSINVTPSTTEKVSKLSATQMMFLTHATNTLTITVYDINSGSSVATQTVSTSFDPDGATTTITAASVCRMTDTTFIVFYARTTDSALYFRTGTISGGTITMDTETAFSGSPTYCFGIDTCQGDADGKVVLVYADSTNNNGSSATIVNKLSYLTCSANTATVTYTATSASIASGAFFAYPVWCVAQFSRGMAYGLFSTGTGSNVGQITYSYIDINSGTTGADNTIPSIQNTTASVTGLVNIRPYFVGHNGKAYFGYKNYVSGVSTVSIYECSPSGCKVIYSTSTINGTSETSTYSIPMFGNEMGIIATGIKNSNLTNGVSIYIQKEKIYGFYNATTLGVASDLPKFSSWYTNSKDEIIVAYGAASGYVKQWKLPTLFDGIVYETVTSGNAAKLIFRSIVTTSSLAIGAKYYLKDNYTNAGEIDAIGTIDIGQGISATQLLVNNT